MKNQITRIISVVMCLLLTIGMLAGCAGNTSEPEQKPSVDAPVQEAPQEEKPEKISVICCSDDVAYLEYLAAQYTEKYGVAVEFISQAYDDTKTKITTSVTSGSADVAYLDVIWPAEFAANGMILPLDDYYTDEMRQNIMAGSLDQMSVDGTIYGVPHANNGTFMFYNKAMLAEAGYTNPPETWEELKEMSIDMQSKGICKYGIAWPGLQAEGSICNMSTLICSFGGSWKDSSGKFAFNSPECVQAIEFMVDSVKDGWADPSSVSYSDRNILDTFLAGDTAFVTNWPYAYGVANDPSQSQVAGDVDVCLVPGANGTRSAFATGGGGMGILSTSKNPDYAWKFIELFANPDNQRYAFINHNFMPTVKQVFEDEEVRKHDPILEKMYPQFEYPANRPAVADYSAWSNAVQIELSSIMVGNVDVATGLNQAVETSNKLLGN